MGWRTWPAELKSKRDGKVPWSETATHSPLAWPGGPRKGIKASFWKLDLPIVVTWMEKQCEWKGRMAVG